MAELQLVGVKAITRSNVGWPPGPGGDPYAWYATILHTTPDHVAQQYFNETLIETAPEFAVTSLAQPQDVYYDYARQELHTIIYYNDDSVAPNGRSDHVIRRADGSIQIYGAPTGYPNRARFVRDALDNKYWIKLQDDLEVVQANNADGTSWGGHTTFGLTYGAA